MTNWKIIHQDFGKSWGEFLQEQWENNGFNYRQTKTWIAIGLTPQEYDLAWWLVNQQKQTFEHLDKDKIKELREQLREEWKDVSSDWNLKIQVAVTKWIRKGFDIHKTKQWLGVGLTLQESELAIQLKEKGHNLSETNLKEIIKAEREKGVSAQQWLDQNYPLKQRINIKKLNISRKNLVGSLRLEGFDNLEELYCYDNQLTGLDCSDCPQLRIARFQKNNLTHFNLTNCSNITELYCNRNNLTNLNFLNSLNSERLETLLIANNNFSTSDLTPFNKFINLKNLGLGNWFQETIAQNIYNRFSGSLKPLEKLAKLEDLDIAGTDVASGLEYLPKDIQVFYCSTSESPESKAELMAQELRKYGETEKDDDGDENFVNPLQTWQGFLNSDAQKWLDINYPTEERSEITYLDISKKNLAGALKLTGFTNLRTLICANNQLTNLNLSGCQNLFTVDCSNNQLRDLYFLKSLKKLECLTIKNNPQLAPQSLKYLISLELLKELNLSDCPLEGSLKSLKKLVKLELLKINSTNIEEGLEYLPNSCKKLYCNSGYESKSIKIVKELDKSKCAEEDKHANRYYNLDKWREDKQNSAIASVAPLERFFVIRSNIRKFIDKWGLKEDNPQWYTNYLNYAKVPYNKLRLEENNLTELNNLQSPEQFNKHWYWTVPQWAGRGAVGVSGVLSFFYDYKVGAITVASPVIETVTSYAKKNYYDAKEKQWNEFAQDTKELLDNYHELLGILTMIKSNELGQLSKTLIKLEKTVKGFLNEYDNNHNGTIDSFELQKDKEKLAYDLNKERGWVGGSKLERMVRLMKRLEEDINDYDQGKLSEEISPDNKKQELAWLIIDWLEEYSDLDFDAEKMYNIKGKEGNYWREKNSWIEYLKEVVEEDVKKHDLNLVQENLLHPLAEVVLEKLKNTNIQGLLADQEKNEQKLIEFLKKIEDLCELCQKLESEELSGAIILLKNKISEFSNYLIEYSAGDKKKQIEIEIKEEKRKLDKIVELIKNLEEEVKTCHESLTKKENKNEEQQSEENQALIEVSLLSIIEV